MNRSAENLPIDDTIKKCSLENTEPAQEVQENAREGDSSPISLVVSPVCSDQSNEEITHLGSSSLTVSSPERKPSRNLQEIDKTLEELHQLTENVYLTTSLANSLDSKYLDKLFENTTAHLRRCETLPEDLSKNLSEDDGEVEEAIRDAEEKQFNVHNNRVGMTTHDTECSSDDDGSPASKFNEFCRTDQSGEIGSLRNTPSRRLRHRISSNATLNELHSMIGHERARSNDSRSVSLFSSSTTSFRRPISRYSIDNSCFDLDEAPTQRSLMCTPIEKMYVKNSRSAPEMRIHDTKVNPFLSSPTPSNEATTTTSEPSVSSEVSMEHPVSPQPTGLPPIPNLKLRLNEGLSETASPISSPVVKPKVKNDKKPPKPTTDKLKMSASSPNMNAQNLAVNVLHPDDITMPLVVKKEENRTFEIVNLSVSSLQLIRKPKKPIYILAKFDTHDIHRSQKLKSENLSHDFTVETTDGFNKLHLVFLEGSKAKVARPVGKVSLARQDLQASNSNTLEQTYNLCAVSKYPDFCGQICIDIRRRLGSFSLRVVDCGGLKLKDNQTLLLLVSIIGISGDVGKLSIDSDEKRSKEWLEMPCNEGMLSLKLTLWQDLLKGINSVFHGQVRVDVDENWKSGPAKWFYLRSKTHEGGENSTDSVDIGEVSLKATYQVDHILRMQVYKPLLDLLYFSNEQQPITASVVALIESLPKVELSPVSRSLVELMAQSNRIRPVLNSLYVNSILKCQDENTLFRGQSLAGKMLFEILTSFGKMYLITTLKPVIDKIFKEHKNCEIDPSRIVAGGSLEKNKSSLLVYFQLLFERVTQSSTNCPHFIKQLLFDLRNVVGKHIDRSEVQRLAVSSFVIMRFFAAAILNPKAFEIRKDQADLRVSRTLLLLSKMLQRVSNCSVSQGPLSSKETWLNGVFEMVTSDQHKSEMTTFLDNISLVGDCSEPELCTVFKFGNLQQVDKSRLAWRKVLHYKKRYVQLTETELIWQKDVQCPPKGTITLADIKSVTVDNKNLISIVTDQTQVQFEAFCNVEASDWMMAIEKQRNRMGHGNDSEESASEPLFDIERHMDNIYNLLYKYRDTITEWIGLLTSDSPLDEKTAPELLKATYVEEADRDKHKKALIETLRSTLDVTDSIRAAHEEYEKEHKNKQSMKKDDNTMCDEFS